MAAVKDLGAHTINSDRDPKCKSPIAESDFVGEITIQIIEGGKKDLKDCDICLVTEFILKDLEIKNNPGYIDIACLTNGRIVVADYKNSRCCLCNSSYQHLSDFKVSSKPWKVCALDTNEVAVVLPDENKIQFLRVDDSIQPSGFMNTKRVCVAVVALSRNELVFCDTGTKTDKNIYWGVITRDGREKSCFHVSSGSMHSRTAYLALNSSKSRVYISCTATKSVLCLGLEGKTYFEYPIENGCPSGIQLDRQDNVYVVVHDSHSIHRLSQDGHFQRIFRLTIPQFPVALSFKPSSDEFIITNGSDNNRRICYIYQLT